MSILLGTVFVASLLGSLHCVGMCGPFALLASSHSNASQSSYLGTVAYSFGRLVAYSAVGAIFGTLGMALNNGTAFTDWQSSATCVAGGLMIVVGTVALARYCGLKIKLPAVFQPVQRCLQYGFQKTKRMSPFARAFTIGALSSLMPCGWLYTFAITAAGTGSPVWGTILMATFWAGTVPVMAALTLGYDRFGIKLQQRIPAIMAALVILVGVFTIAYRAPIAIDNEQFQVVQGSQNLVEHVSQIDHEQLPCCCGDSK